MGCVVAKPGEEAIDQAKRPTAHDTAHDTRDDTPNGVKDNFGLLDRVVVKPLGEGGTSEAYLCRRIATGQHECVKVLRRPVPRSMQRLLTNEIMLQASLGEGHVSIVSAHEVALTESHLCLFMDYIPGGTLTSYVSSRASRVVRNGGLFLDEDEARYLFQQIIEAVEFCHERRVIHRDLKLDNVLLDKSNPPKVKLCDFGFARIMNGSDMTYKIGTPVYMAPQMMKKRPGQTYDGRAVDVWACGVTLFVMLLGTFPFEHKSSDEQRAFKEVLVEQIRGHWTENERTNHLIPILSPECRDLLDRMFQLKESKRITVPQIKKHPWYTKPLLPKYADAMAALKREQAAIGTCTKEPLFKENSRLKLNKDTVKDVVMRACSRSPGAESAELEGRSIKLTGVASQQCNVLDELAGVDAKTSASTANSKKQSLE